MLERVILLWPGIVLAALAAVALVATPERRGHFWGYDLLGGIGVAGGGLLIVESQRTDVPADLELTDLFIDLFEGWPQAALMSVVAAAILLVAVIIVRRSLPSWQRALAQSIGVVTVVVLAHLWAVGL